MSVNEKLMRIQTHIKAPKNLHNSFGNYKYRNAEGIFEAVKPYLVEHNCSLDVSDKMVEIGGRVYVEATVTITDIETGETKTATAYAREAVEKRGMDDSQVTGATSSYARKYALNGLFLLDDTKDADTDEYHNTINNAKAEEKLSKAKNYDTENIPTSANANEKCSEKQVKFIESLIKQKGLKAEDFISQYKGAKNFSDLTKAQAKALIDYLSRE